MPGFKPISEKFLSSPQRLALGFAGEASKTIGWVFARIMGVEPTRLKPFTNGLTPIAPNGTLALTQLIEPISSEPALEVPRELAKTLIYHIGVGLNPPKWLRMYLGYPSGQFRGRVENINPPTPGNDYSYVTGEDTPYGDPTDAAELFLPFGVTADFAFSNEDPRWTHQPVLNVEMRKYHVEFFNPKIQEHADLIRRMALGTAQAYWWPVGTQRNLAPYMQEDYWRVPALTLEQARSLGGEA